MEDLTKHQLILITLLVSFVTSIATGIITFTLLSEAPVEVTQQINHIVEKTIEKVAPTEEGKPAQTVTTVVVNEEDRILDAISKNEKSMVRIKTQNFDGSQLITGIGFVVSEMGAIVTESRSYNTGLNYSIVFYDGKEYPIKNVFTDPTNRLVFMQTALPKSEKYVFYPAVLGDSDGLKVGQTLIAISGRDSNSASIGRIRQLEKSEDKKSVMTILSDIPVSRTALSGMASNLSGEIIGIELPSGQSDNFFSYRPINVVKSAIPAALSELSK